METEVTQLDGVVPGKCLERKSVFICFYHILCASHCCRYWGNEMKQKQTPALALTELTSSWGRLIVIGYSSNRSVTQTVQNKVSAMAEVEMVFISQFFNESIVDLHYISLYQFQVCNICRVPDTEAPSMAEDPRKRPTPILRSPSWIMYQSFSVMVINKFSNASVYIRYFCLY